MLVLLVKALKWFLTLWVSTKTRTSLAKRKSLFASHACWHKLKSNDNNISFMIINSLCNNLVFSDNKQQRFRLKTLEQYGEKVLAYKPPKVPTEEGNILLEFLRTLIFTELGEFSVTRPAPPTKPPTPDVIWNEKKRIFNTKALNIGAGSSDSFCQLRSCANGVHGWRSDWRWDSSVVVAIVDWCRTSIQKHFFLFRSSTLFIFHSNRMWNFQTDPIKQHVVNAKPKKKKFWQKGFMKFFFKGKQSTASGH